MEYEIELLNVEREEAEREHWAAVMYRFTISDGSAQTLGEVVFTEGGVNIIKKKGKDPLTAARVALERLLRQGRDPFSVPILLKIPFGHAEYFSRFGNYETLPTLVE